MSWLMFSAMFGRFNVSNTASHYTFFHHISNLTTFSFLFFALEWKLCKDGVIMIRNLDMYAKIKPLPIQTRPLCMLTFQTLWGSLFVCVVQLSEIFSLISIHTILHANIWTTFFLSCIARASSRSLFSFLSMYIRHII